MTLYLFYLVVKRTLAEFENSTRYLPSRGSGKLKKNAAKKKEENNAKDCLMIKKHTHLN